MMPPRPTLPAQPARRLLLALPLLWAVAASAQGPRQNLWLELRWVEQDLSGAAVAGVRDAAVVVGTGGSVSPRGAVVLSTQSQAQRQQQLPRLLVLNGQRASVTLGESSPAQGLDWTLQREQGRPDRVYASPRSESRSSLRSLSVRPQWPGGQQPVTVELSAQEQGPADRSGEGQLSQQLLSTVQVPLGQWVTVARAQMAGEASQRGVISTRDAQRQTLRELQLRVELAP